MVASVRWILRISSWIVFVQSTCADALNTDNTQASIFDYYQDFGNSSTPNATKYTNVSKNNTIIVGTNATKSHKSKPTTNSPTPVKNNNNDDYYYYSNTTNEPTAAPTMEASVNLSHWNSNSTNTTSTNHSTITSSPVFGHSFDTSSNSSTTTNATAESSNNTNSGIAMDGNVTNNNNDTLVVSSLNDDTIGSNSSDSDYLNSTSSLKNSTQHTNKTKSFHDTLAHSSPWNMSLEDGNTTNHSNNATTLNGSLNDTAVSNSSDYLNGNYFTNNETTTLDLLNTTNNSSEYYFGNLEDDRKDDDPPPPPEYPNSTTTSVLPHASTTISVPTSSPSPTDTITIVPFPKFDGHENPPLNENNQAEEEEETSYYNTDLDDTVGDTSSNEMLYSSTDDTNDKQRNEKLVPIVVGLVFGFFIVAWELQRNPDGLCANLTYCLVSLVWFLITTPILFLWRLFHNRAAVRSGIYGEPEYFQEGSFQPSRSYREDRYLPRDLELS